MKQFGILILIALTSCVGKVSNKQLTSANISKNEYAFVSHIHHAGYFTIINHDTWKQIVVFDPWKQDTLSNYALVLKDDSLPDSLPQNITLVRVPISTIAILSATHIGPIALLNKRDAIVGINDGDLLYDSVIKQRFKEGKIQEISRQMSDNIEQILAMSPELLMKSGFDNVQSQDTRIKDAGIPIAYNVEWMESTLLGRAEWIKFVAAFFCKEKTADSLFTGIETRYNEAQKLVTSAIDRPTVLVGLSFKGTWYMPGDSTYLAKLLHDAGARYETNNHGSSSLPYSFEQIFDKHANDLFWINANAPSLESQQAMDERYSLFKAFTLGNVYNFDKRINAAGGNDYWETSVTHPDMLLQDMIKIFHPQLLPTYETVYLRKLINH